MRRGAVAAARLAALAALGVLGILAGRAAVSGQPAGTAARVARPAPAAAPSPAAPAGAGPVETQSYGRFGQVAVYRQHGKAQGVAVLLSDDSGWDARADSLARSLQSVGALVIGLDVSYYERKSDRLTQDCGYPAGDFEMLSKLVQKKLELPAYTAPVLAGYGAGATLAYGALAQGPEGTFAGAISMGFCPELDASHPLCTGRGLVSQPLGKEGGFRLQPVASLDQPWLLTPDPVPGAEARCGGTAAAETFAGKVKGAAVVAPPKGNAKHQAAVDLRAAAGIKQAYLRVLNDADLARPPLTPEQHALRDLPLMELPVPGSTTGTLAVIVSGDGGWTGLDRDVARLLAERGYPVVGLNTLQYFWTPRTPEGAAADLARILRTYMPAWNLKEAMLIGYSLGGEVLPFMVDRLPPDLLGKVRLVSLLGPGRTTSFRFVLSEWLGHGGGENRPVRPEVERLKGSAIACIYGAGERGTSLCSNLPATLATAIELPGAHYLGGNPRQVVNRVLNQLAAAAPRKEPGTQTAAAPAPAKPEAKQEPAEGGKKKTWPPTNLGPSNPMAPPPQPASPPPPPPPTGTGSGTGAGAGLTSAPLALLQLAGGPGAGLPALPAGQAGGGEETLQYGRFGAVHLLRRSPHPAHVALFFSGEDGWDAGAAAMAETFAERGFLAVGIDTRHYLQKLAAQHESCAYTAGSLENLSKVVQKRLGQPHYDHPLVAGYAGGAALAYGALAQAPPYTFRGGIGLALCPALPGGQALCPGHGFASKHAAGGALDLAPAHGLEQGWVSIQGGADRACPAAAAAPLARAAAGGAVVTVPGVDHSFARAALWQPALRQAIDGYAAGGEAKGAAARTEVVDAATIPGLPLVEIAPGALATGAGRGGVAAEGAGAPGALLAVVVSGDGGWAGVDREVAKELAGRHGVPVVGLDSLEYFWNGRTPAQAGADLARVLRHYLTAWRRDGVLLVGYSLGADVLPFMASRLPPDLLARVRVIALLGPSPTTPLEIRVKEDRKSELPVLPELQKLRGRPILCVGARGEADSLCPAIGPLGQSVELDASHAFTGDYGMLADRILAAARRTAGG